MTTTTTDGQANISSDELRHHRRAAGITQARLAALAGCSLAFVGNLERGYVPKRSAAVPRILKVLARRRPVAASDNPASTAPTRPAGPVDGTNHGQE